MVHEDRFDPGPADREDMLIYTCVSPLATPSFFEQPAPTSPLLSTLKCTLRDA